MVAVGILALMFALGTFNAQKAGADTEAGSVELSLSTQNADEHVEVTVSYTEDEAEQGTDAIVITFEGLVLDTDAGDYEVTVTGPISQTATYEYTVPSGSKRVDATAGTLTLDLPAADDDLNDETTDVDEEFVAGRYTVEIEAGDNTNAAIKTTMDVAGSTVDDTTVDATVVKATVGDVHSNEIKTGYTGALSSQNAGAGVSVIIRFALAADQTIAAGDDVVIEMKGFQLPADIDPDAISISDGNNTANAADASTQSTWFQHLFKKTDNWVILLCGKCCWRGWR